MDQESLRLLLAQGMSVERIAQRFGRHPSTVSYWMNKHGLEAPNREKHAARGGIDREELTAAVAAGLTIAGLAETFTCSKATIRHWLARYGLQTKAAERAADARTSRREGKLTRALTCAQHGESRVRSGGAWLLPVQALSPGTGGSAAQTGQGDSRRGGRWGLLSLWL